jgi:hypothetical protein
MLKYYKIEIHETYKSRPSDEKPYGFNSDISQAELIVKEFFTLDDVKKYLIERYGKMPGMKNKIYQDTRYTEEGKTPESIECGFTHSYWNRDISHASKSWYQTDWISIYEVEEKIVLL